MFNFTEIPKKNYISIFPSEPACEEIKQKRKYRNNQHAYQCSPTHPIELIHSNKNTDSRIQWKMCACTLFQTIELFENHRLVFLSYEKLSEKDTDKNQFLVTNKK